MNRLFLFTLLFLVPLSTINAQKKEVYQTLFIYNFSKYIKWPDAYNSGKFVIGVIGNSPIKESISTMVATKKTKGGLPMLVETYNTVEEIGDCNILFVSKDALGNLGEIDTKIGSNPVLIVTDMPGMATQGSIINFVESNGKIKFELNSDKATSRGLVVSGSLASLAIII